MVQILSDILNHLEVIDDLIDTGDSADLQRAVDALWLYLTDTKHEQWLNSLRSLK